MVSNFIFIKPIDAILNKIKIKSALCSVVKQLGEGTSRRGLSEHARRASSAAYAEPRCYLHETGALCFLFYSIKDNHNILYVKLNFLQSI